MKLLWNWNENKFKISKYNMGEQEPKSRGKINMKKTKTVRYKRQEDVKLDDFGNLTTKTVVEKMTEKEHKKLFKETAI